MKECDFFWGGGAAAGPQRPAYTAGGAYCVATRTACFSIVCLNFYSVVRLYLNQANR